MIVIAPHQEFDDAGLMPIDEAFVKQYLGKKAKPNDSALVMVEHKGKRFWAEIVMGKFIHYLQKCRAPATGSEVAEVEKRVAEAVAMFG